MWIYELEEHRWKFSVLKCGEKTEENKNVKVIHSPSMEHRGIVVNSSPLIEKNVLLDVQCFCEKKKTGLHFWLPSGYKMF